MATSAQDLMNTVATSGYEKLSPLGVEQCILAALGDGGGGGSGQVTQGNGIPDPAGPSDPTQPAMYTDLDTGIIYSWSVPGQVWI